MQRRAIGRERVNAWRAFPGFYAWPFVVVVVVESFLLKFNPIINLISVDSSRVIAAFIVATASDRL